MSSFKKFALTAAIATAVAGFVSPASAIIVGGIDFGAIGANPNNNHLETATLAQTFVNGVGQLATAYGVVSTVNGDNTYCADNTSNCALYYVSTTTSRSFSNTYASFGNTVVKLYYANVAQINLLGQSSAANIAYIQSLPVWASFAGAKGVDLIDSGADQSGGGSLTGASLSVLGTGLLNVNKGDGLGIAAVENYLDANSIGAFGGNPNADIAVTYSANNLLLNPFDVANGAADSCSGPNQQVGDFCYQGTTNFRGKTNPTPEPGVLALVGLALAGIGFTRRAKKEA